MKVYEKFKQLKINLSALGLEQGSAESDYFCTPAGARVIFWTGVDGIHYCTIRGFGEMIFVVCPMNSPGKYVYPVARNFTDFLLLLLACRDEAAISQVSGWEREHFDSFLEELAANAAPAAVLEEIEKTFDLSPMEDAFAYIKGLQAEFDYRKLKFKPEYEEWAPPEPKVPTAPEWKVYFNGNFWGHHGRERAGREIPVGRQFVWGEEIWHVPAVYACTSGLVIDLCCEVEPETVKAFMEKWNLLQEKEFSDDEQERMQAEHPLNMNARVKAELNGVRLKQSGGCGTSWIPESICDTEGDMEGRWILEHYGLNQEKAWGIFRYRLPWAGKRKLEIRTLTITLMQEPTPIPGIRFHTPKAGESLMFNHPVTGEEHTLTVDEVVSEKIESPHLGGGNMEFPTHCMGMTYRLSPELPNRTFHIRDCRGSDSPRPKAGAVQTGAGMAASSIGIIGGADGPTAVFLGAPRQAQRHKAYSSLHFEPVEDVEWRMTFREKLREDITVELI